ncbi:SMP-30/gluconolactonase/LRE family protein [Nibrella saemangeumensis]|uniref:SMP-30/gluconolactonase/LRE family protein n=1 Tax=Nibrella saemangeumensis TaxID=1084526 RepID=A0ABP8NKI4_9BACT
MSVQPELLLDAKATLGEGSLWHPLEHKLYWVDIEGKALHIFDPATEKDIAFLVGERIGTVVPVQTGGALVALQSGIHHLNTDTGELNQIIQPLTDSEIRFNDGKCDPAGRFWVGSMHLEQKDGAASLYRMDTDKSVQVMLTGVTISNGIVWTSDRKTMYYIDTPTSTVQAFDYDNQTGAISHGRTAIDTSGVDGFPDGMTIDADDKLWIAFHSGGCVTRWDPATGNLLQKIDVPAPNTTSCAFGGAALDTLYITTAREGLSADQLAEFPFSGGLFAVKPGVKGVPAFFYKGL